MAYTPPPIKRRDVVVNIDGSTSLSDGKTGFFRRLGLWLLVIAVIALLVFLTLGSISVPIIAQIPFLNTLQQNASKILSNIVSICRQLFDAM